MDESKVVWKAVPVAIDAELEAEVDLLAKSKGQKKSVVMREAMRAGIPILKAGGLSEVVPVDSELQADIDNVTKWKGLKRGKILLEALKIGLPVVNVRLPNADEKDGTSSDDYFQLFAANDPKSVPVARDLMRAENHAAYWRDLVEQICRLSEAARERDPKGPQPGVRELKELVMKVHEWMRRSGKPRAVSRDGVGWLSVESFAAHASEMLAEEASVKEKGIETGSKEQTVLQKISGAPASSEPGRKPGKPTGKPRKE